MVYRYFNFNENSLSFLISKKLWVSHPSKFNDPFDSVFQVDLMGSPSDTIEKHQNEQAICCFSEKHDSILMWSHYADSHKGFCVGFDKNSELFCDPKLFQKVFYEKEEFSFYINPTDEKMYNSKDEYQEFDKLFTTKYEDWAYEKEWRLILTLDLKEPDHYPHGRFIVTNAVKTIYFGCKMPEEHKEIIKAILGADVIYKNMNINSGKFALVES